MCGSDGTPAASENAAGHRERDHRDGTVVRGDGRAVGGGQATQRAQDGVEQQRYQCAEGNGAERVRQHRERRLARQFDAALQPDRHQQVNG
jgi:hypothetical protein